MATPATSTPAQRRRSLLEATPLGRAVLGLPGCGPAAAEFAWDETRRQRDAHGRWLPAGLGVPVDEAVAMPARDTADGRQLVNLLSEGLNLTGAGRTLTAAQCDHLYIAADKMADLGLDKTGEALRAVLATYRTGDSLQTSVGRAEADRLNPLLAAAHRELFAHGVTVALPDAGFAPERRGNTTVSDAGSGWVAAGQGDASGHLADLGLRALPAEAVGHLRYSKEAGVAALQNLTPAALAALALRAATNAADDGERTVGVLGHSGPVHLLRGLQTQDSTVNVSDSVRPAWHLDAVNYEAWQDQHLHARLHAAAPVHNADGTTTLASELVRRPRGEGLATVTAVQGKDGHEDIAVRGVPTTQSSQNRYHQGHLVGAALAQAALRGAQAVRLNVPTTWTNGGANSPASGLYVLVARGIATRLPADAGTPAHTTTYAVHAPAPAAYELLGGEFVGEGAGDRSFRLSEGRGEPGHEAVVAAEAAGLEVRNFQGVLAHQEFRLSDGHEGGGSRSARVAELRQQPGAATALLTLPPATGAVPGARSRHTTLITLALACHEAHLRRLSQVTVPSPKRNDAIAELVRAKAAKRVKGAYLITDLPAAVAAAEKLLAA